MRIITIAFALIPIFSWGSGITNGDFELTFIPETKGQDRAIGQQTITITNLSWTHNLTAMCFGVVIETSGSLKRFEGDRQIIPDFAFECSLAILSYEHWTNSNIPPVFLCQYSSFHDMNPP